MNGLPKYTVLVCAVLLSACATVSMTPESLDSEAKTFVPQQGMCSIYVGRDGSVVGSAVLFQVVVDGKVAGAIAPNTYHLLSVTPGEHDVAVFATGNTKQIKVVTEAGKNYFFNVSGRMGWAYGGRVSLKQLSDDNGRKLVTECKRAETMGN